MRKGQGGAGLSEKEEPAVARGRIQVVVGRKRRNREAVMVRSSWVTVLRRKRSWTTTRRRRSHVRRRRRRSQAAPRRRSLDGVEEYV